MSLEAGTELIREMAIANDDGEQRLSVNVYSPQSAYQQSVGGSFVSLTIDSLTLERLEITVTRTPEFTTEFVINPGQISKTNVTEPEIITASFSNNSINYTTTTYNSATLNHDLSKAELAASYIEERIAAGKLVLIGTHYTNGTWNPPNNANRATRHYMVIVGIGTIGGKKYFRFYDPGRSAELTSEATSVNNKLIFEKSESCIKGSYNGKVYTISEVLKTN